VSNPEDRREHKREAYHSALSLQIVFASVAPELLGKKLTAETIDISPSGLGIILDHEVPVDCTLDVRVTLKENSEKIFFLTGKVRWCKPAGETGKYAAGIALHERTDTTTDLDAWKKTLHSY